MIGNVTEITTHILTATASDLVNKGPMAEMLAGLELLHYQKYTFANIPQQTPLVKPFTHWHFKRFTGYVVGKETDLPLFCMNSKGEVIITMG